MWELQEGLKLASDDDRVSECRIAVGGAEPR
jgi:hypothetical protein